MCLATLCRTLEKHTLEGSVFCFDPGGHYYRWNGTTYSLLTTMVMSNFPIFSVGISVVRVCETNSCYIMLINMVAFQSSNVDINYKKSCYEHDVNP